LVIQAVVINVVDNQMVRGVGDLAVHFYASSHFPLTANIKGNYEDEEFLNSQLNLNLELGCKV